MIKAAFSFVLTPRFKGYKIYFHNFSYFDSIFILKTLIGYKGVRVIPKFRETRLLSLTIQYLASYNSKTRQVEYKGSVTIYDSMLILPSSLEKLVKAFGDAVMVKAKGMFPHKFCNRADLDWNYEGPVPGIEFFHAPKTLNPFAHISFKARYNEYCSKFQNNWNLKRELLSYCESDAKATHKVIVSFGQRLYDLYTLNYMRYPTLPSMALAIFRIKFLGSTEIPILSGDVDRDIRKSYYGGFVDVYRSFARFVKSYDVNSLYPDAMSRFLMPVGTPIYMEGKHLKLEDIFGFAYVEVTCDVDMHTPILPYKDNRPPFATRYPVGT